MRHLASFLLLAGAIGCAGPEGDPGQVLADRAALTEHVAGLYQSWSGPAGPRDLDGLRARFVDGATLQGFGFGGPDGGPQLRSQSVDEWLVGAEEYFASTDLYERQTRSAATVMGDMGHVFSEYESRVHPDSAPFQRGLSSVVMARTADGWRIVSALNVDLP